MYLSSTEAINELASRRKDPLLRKRVNDFLGGSLPTGFPDYPVAVLPRHIASCREEDLAFVAAAEACGLEPWWYTYLQDAYTDNNPDKANYVNFAVRRNGRGNYKVKLVNDMARLNQAKPALGSIATKKRDANGNTLSLPEVHLRMRQAALPDYAENHVDASPWLKWQAERMHVPSGARSTCNYYYAANLAQYLVHGIMFEDYHGGPNAKRLEPFVTNVVHPAIRTIQNELGLQPLIVQLPWRKEYGFYPETVLEALVDQPIRA